LSIGRKALENCYAQSGNALIKIFKNEEKCWIESGAFDFSFSFFFLRKLQQWWWDIFVS